MEENRFVREHVQKIQEMFWINVLQRAEEVEILTWENLGGKKTYARQVSCDLIFFFFSCKKCLIQGSSFCERYDDAHSNVAPS